MIALIGCFITLPCPCIFETFLWRDVEPLTWTSLPLCSHSIIEDMMKLIDAGSSGLKKSNNIEVVSLVLCLSSQVYGKNAVVSKSETSNFGQILTSIKSFSIEAQFNSKHCV